MPYTVSFYQVKVKKLTGTLWFLLITPILLVFWRFIQYAHVYLHFDVNTKVRVARHVISFNMGTGEVSVNKCEKVTCDTYLKK